MAGGLTRGRRVIRCDALLNGRGLRIAVHEEAHKQDEVCGVHEQTSNREIEMTLNVKAQMGTSSRDIDQVDAQNHLQNLGNG